MNYQMRETANGTDIKGVQIMVDIKKKVGVPHPSF